jgi:chromosome segregation ATPase
MLDFIKDVIGAFRQTSLERVKSPFLGAFVFSWVAFNWQALVILLFSEKTVEKRLGIINDHYDVGSFLLGPICTSILITFLLPQINKIITKIQDKPNSDTIELTLTSKIKIAELQQSIAEIEARKKLADKKEEKYIEESIYRIKEENSKLNEQLLSSDLMINDLNTKLREITIEENNYKTMLNAEKESRHKAEQNVSKISNDNTVLNSNIRDLEVKIGSTERAIDNLLNEKNTFLTQIEEFKNQLTTYQGVLSELILKYPSIFRGRLVNGHYEINISDRAEQELNEVNGKLMVEIYNNKKVVGNDKEPNNINPINA